MNNMSSENNHLMIQVSNVYEEILSKFHDREVTIQFDGSIHFCIDITRFGVYNKQFKNKGNLIFLTDEDKATDESIGDILSIEEKDIICAMHGMFDDINIYLKNGQILQIYGYEG